MSPDSIDGHQDKIVGIGRGDGAGNCQGRLMRCRSRNGFLSRLFFDWPCLDHQGASHQAKATHFSLKQCCYALANGQSQRCPQSVIYES